MSEPRQSFREADLLSAGAQLCYIYTLHASNDPERKPRYVGFSCKPKRRGAEHNRGHENGRKGDWVRSLLAIGAKAVFTIVHSFRTLNVSERVLVEDTWIGAYQKKYPDLLNDMNGGTGVADPSDRFRKNRSAAMKRRYADPKERQKQSEIQKRRYAKNPAAAKKHSKAMKEHYASPVAREKTRRSSLEAWRNEERKKKTSEAAKRFWANSENRKRMIEERKRRCADPLVRKKMSEMGKRGALQRTLNGY